MKIAQLAPPFVRIPPEKYGGTELVVHNLTEELVRRGHEVTLFASGDSRTSARLIPTVERALWDQEAGREPLPYFALAVGRCYALADEFDVIHNHMDFQPYTAARLADTPTLTTLHGRLDLPALEPLYREFHDLPLVSISNAQRAPLRQANWVATVYNGIDVDAFPFGDGRGGYLAFLGRITPDKGLHTAVAVARRVGMKLLVGARLPLANADDDFTKQDRRYYEEVVRPLFHDPCVEFLGELDHAGKCRLLAAAAALLFPIEWPEPFGLVMAEAMACGTPVIATRWGSVPEVVAHGETGYICDSFDELVWAVYRAREIDRRACRHRVERHFSVRAMADGYERVYAALVGNAPGLAAPPGEEAA
jgi:glycosyltransferase involved in cell wall biosynthesis